MSSSLRIGIIIGSTRPGRVGDQVAAWVQEHAARLGEAEYEIVDLAEVGLPLLDEAIPASAGRYTGDHTHAWAATVDSFDGFIFVVAEYNHSITASLKNALDEAYKEWGRKPFTAIGYGAVGAARAIEHLRLIAIELQMVSTHAAVHIGGGDFMTVFPMGGNKPIEDIEAHLLPNTKTALDELVWWAKATMAAKAES